MWKKTVGLVVLMMGAGLVGPAQAEKFSMITLPDTQNYSEYAPGTFSTQTQWIVDNADDLNIKYVSHLGDIVQHGPDLDEWTNAVNAMSILDDAGIPYGACIGNHDNHYNSANYQYGPEYYVAAFDHYEDPTGAHYLDNFGPDKYAGKSWFGGASPSGLSNYQVINGGGMDFLYLNLKIDTPKVELDWAQDVLAANRDKAVVVSTHRYLWDFRLAAGRYGETVTDGPMAGFNFVDVDYDPQRVLSETVFNDFIKSNDNIFMVQCGHFHSEYYRTDSMNNAGLQVAEILTDYQDAPNGGDGWLRIYEFDTELNQIDVSTYSPTLGRYRSVMDDYLDTLGMVDEYGPMLQQMLGMTETEYQGFLAQLQADMPGFDMTQHPEFGILVDYFGSAENVPAWEGLFAQSFLDGSRNPQFTLNVDFDAYIPEPATLTLLALGGLGLIPRKR